MLEVLKASHSLKSWTIYNDRYNGDVVVRVRFTQDGQIGQAGETISAATYKRKTPHQAARDKARAENYKQYKNAKLIHNNSHNIGKSSLRTFAQSDVEVNRNDLNLSISPANVISYLESPVHPSSPVSSPVQISYPSSPVSHPAQIGAVSHSVQISPVPHPAQISLVSSPEQIPYDLQPMSPLSQHGQLTSTVCSPVHSPSHIDNPPSSTFSSPVQQPNSSSVADMDQLAVLSDIFSELRESMREFSLSMDTKFQNISILKTANDETIDESPD